MSLDIMEGISISVSCSHQQLWELYSKYSVHLTHVKSKGKHHWREGREGDASDMCISLSVHVHFPVVIDYA